MSKIESNSKNEKSDFSYDLEPNQVSILDIQICSEEDDGFKILRLDAWNPLHGSKCDEAPQPSDGKQIGKSQLFNRVQMDCKMNKNYFQIVESMRYFFAKRESCTNVSESKEVHYDPNDLNFPQIQYCITFLSQLKEHFIESWPYDMNGSRIMIALHHDSNQCAVKLVDMSKSSEQKNEDFKNDSFIHGLNNVINILKVFMFAYDFKQSQIRKELIKATEKKQEERKKLDRNQQQARKWKSILHDYDVDSVQMEGGEGPITIPRNQDELTQIDVELVSNCFSEDEEIIEWETLITNGFDEKQKQPPAKQEPFDKKTKLNLRPKAHNGIGCKYRVYFKDYKILTTERAKIKARS